jgi:hypothetical protein
VRPTRRTNQSPMLAGANIGGPDSDGPRAQNFFFGHLEPGAVDLYAGDSSTATLTWSFTVPPEISSLSDPNTCDFGAGSLANF